MKQWYRLAAAAVVSLAVAPCLLAQGGPPGGGGPGGGGQQFQLPPQVMAKFKAWEKWNASHKHVSALQTTLMNLGQLEMNDRTKLTKEQAKKILPVLKTWRKKPKITDDQALQINKQLTAPLNEAQLKRLATAPQFGRRSGGGGGMGSGGGMGRGGGAGGGGGQRRFDPSKIQIPDPQEYNPLNPDTNPFLKTNPQMKTMASKMMSDFIAKVEARAK
ncbi:MAG: hypothetical protein IT210_13800 [Armatimonadetes bacterium]|nr:hypothetical protein [Armatimonadota bacterium]